MPKSIYSEPMPSPNGTNYERLYIVRKPFAEAMAMDAAMGAKFGGYGSANNGDPDDVVNAPDNEGYDLADKIRQLLEGKLDDGDISALIALIQPDDDAAPAPAAQDRRGRRQAADRMLSGATMERLVAEGAVRRAAASQRQFSDLVKRFPNLKNARVV